MNPLLWLAAPLLLGPLFVLNALVLLRLLRRRAVRPRPPGPPAPAHNGGGEGGLAPLRERLDRVSRAMADASALIASAGRGVGGVQARLDDHTAAGWQALQEARDRYVSTVRGLLLLKDHLEGLPEEKASEPGAAAVVALCQRQIGKIMAEAGIRAAADRPGEPFDGSRHKVVSSRPDPSPPGTLVEIVRPGYVGGPASGDPLVLRPAEVIVSAGPRRLEPAENESGECVE